MFIYDPLFYAYKNPDKIHLKVFYFPLEESIESITLRFMAHLLAKLSNDTIRISPLDLKSTNESKPVPQEVLDLLDHKDINELPYFKGESPSSEMISMFIYNQLKERIPLVSKISVWETPTSCASYYEVE